MAGSSEVVKKVMRFKLQLTDTPESVTVLKILQKLKDLDITLDILAETGIGKTVNSLRRHEQAGEFAKLLIRSWKTLVPKEVTSQTGDGDVSDNLSVTNLLDEQNCEGRLMKVDLNNNCLSCDIKSQDSTGTALFKTGNGKADSEKRCEEQNRHVQDKNKEKSPYEKHNVSQKGISKKKMELHEDKMDNSIVSMKKNNIKSEESLDLIADGNSEDTEHKSSLDPREKIRSSSDFGRLGSEKESNKKPKASKESFKESKDSPSLESNDKYSKTLQQANVRDDQSSGVSEVQHRKRKKTNEDKHASLKSSSEYENKGHSKHKHKKVQMKHKDEESDGFSEQPTTSFESCLNYDINVFRRKKSGRKKVKTDNKGAIKDLGAKALKSPVSYINTKSSEGFKESVMDLMNIPSTAVLPECEKTSSVEYLERKVEKDSDFCEVAEESAGFTGQRLNRKMQVYSGAKTVFLPTMMSLYQQCIRTLQNNISLLYETGGVPFEILEPVLERCTPEQLLRIEEYNPIYIGVTDHLWGKHCERDFKHSSLQEYESWKEMYIRLSEERERKLQRLTKTIVSAHSKKPKGRQVKMAFIHTVAKPPRDVRIQQEIHGTAVQQPHIKCSVKIQDNRLRPSCNDPSRSITITSGGGNAQDPRKKTRVAPMMAKSLKAFKKHLGRR
ncbi:elongin A, like [Antennarius striatus]|uniref:elongin A, like n=1 Tax=Antennarius striatus TaxID=241820 RepID=UPI0035AE1EE0